MGTLDLGGRLSGVVIGAALEVHRALGPGLLESVYLQCLGHELERREVKFRREVPVPVSYRGLKIGAGYRIDLFVEDELIVEVKAQRSIEEVHLAQVLTYLRCMNKPLGLLINFDVPILRQGIRRVANSRAGPTTPPKR